MIAKHLTAMDALILGLAAALLAGLYARLWAGTGEPGERASVWVAGEQRASLRLDEPRTLRVHGALGESVIQVRDGQVRVVDSPGRQKLCVKAGWLSRGGESAICLPNQVVVRVDGRQPRFDAVNF